MARLNDVADALLAAVSAAFARTPDPPAFQWIADGTNPILDFGLESSLVVMWDGNRMGSASQGLASGGASAEARGIDASSIMSGAFSVYVWRPIPVMDDSGNAPSIEEIQGAARQQQDDAYLVFHTILRGFAEGELLGSCGEANIIDQVPFAGDGGVEGSRLRVAVTL